MDFSSLLNIAKSAAPVLLETAASAVPGGGIAVKLLEAVTDSAPGTSPDSMAASLAGNPALMAQYLTALAAKEQEQIRQKGETERQRLAGELDALKARLADMANARDMGRVYVQSEDKFIRRFLPYLALVVVVCSFIYDVLLIFVHVDPQVMPMAYGLAGSLTTLAGFAGSYYFGSSHGSAQKSEQIASFAGGGK